ncbi:MAG TPA: hypothetical protein VH639_19910 [Bryobacteraceae bacterium]|jgi:hypothetical protein
MNDFDNDLRRTLRRRQPPRDLTAGVMARIAQPAKRSIFAVFHWRPLLAAAAAVLILAAGIGQYREYRRGQEAKRQVMFALEITAQKLAVVQEKIDELNQRSIAHDR